MTRSATSRCAPATLAGANRPVAPAPTNAGLLGIARITGTPPPHQLSRAEMRIPAAIDITIGRVCCSAGWSGVRTAPATCGLTATTMTDAGPTATALSAVACTPKSAERASLAASELSPTVMCSGRVPRRSIPPISARPMLPPPRIARCLLLIRVDCSQLLPCRRIRWSGSAAEQCRADPYDGRAFQDGGLEVAAHPHRQRVELRPCSIESFEQAAHAGEGH